MFPLHLLEERFLCLKVSEEEAVLTLQDILFPSGLNLEVRKGTNVMIMGETGKGSSLTHSLALALLSGSGKSSIFRVLGGLWEPLRGYARLCVPHSHHYVMFLPQKPHLTTGTLADQVCFPERPKLDGADGEETVSDLDNANCCLFVCLFVCFVLFACLLFVRFQCFRLESE